MKALVAGPRAWVVVVVALILVGGGLGLWAHSSYYLWLFAPVVRGGLYRSRQPTGRQWALLERNGIRTVINLRPRGEDPEAFDEERTRCEAAGVRLVELPVTAEAPDDEKILSFLRETRRGPAPVLVHCEHGRNRTGVMVAAYRIVVQGWSVGKAMADLESFGPNLDDAKRRKLVRLLARLHAQRDLWRRRTGPSPAETP